MCEGCATAGDCEDGVIRMDRASVEKLLRELRRRDPRRDGTADGQGDDNGEDGDDR